MWLCMVCLIGENRFFFLFRLVVFSVWCLVCDWMMLIMLLMVMWLSRMLLLFIMGVDI